MEIILEFFLQVVLEFVLQIFGELLVELGLRSLMEPFRRDRERNAFLAFFGYALLGVIVGGMSLLIFPQSFVRSGKLHGVNLLITPILAGLVMWAMGWLRERQGKSVIRLDSFSYGFVFAFGMALVRFLFTT